MNRRFASSCTAIAAVLALTLSPLVAQASPEEVNGSAASSEMDATATATDEAAYDTLRQEMTRQGITASVQESLIDKLKRGETWDSTNGSQPVSVTTWSNRGERSVYADGSISITEVEQPPILVDEDPTPTAVSGCVALSDYQGWKRRRDCKVSVNKIVWRMSFIAGYDVKTNNPGKIVGTPYMDSITYFVPGGSYSNITMRVNRRVQDGSAPANARLSATFRCGLSTCGTTTGWVQLNVTTRAWSTNA